jgi:hypothetical protein
MAQDPRKHVMDTAVKTSQKTVFFDHTWRPTIKRNPWPLVRKRTIPTERPPLADEI